MIVKRGLVEIEGKILEVGSYIVANDKSDYKGLIGVIEMIRTGKDKETENETDDIIVSFETPTNPKIISELEETFTALCGEIKHIDEIAIDEVVCSVDEIDMK